MAERVCAIDGCERRPVGRGWCDMHYRRWKHHGHPLGGGAKPRGSIPERFWPKVNKDGPLPDGKPEMGSCWAWTAATDKLDYGVFCLGVHKRRAEAHRVAYELLVGPIPAGLELDHLCRNHNCVNPAHLEPVTHRENMLRGETVGAFNALKTHCKVGHVFDEVNTRIRPNGKRECRVCDRDAQRLRRAASRS